MKNKTKQITIYDCTIIFPSVCSKFVDVHSKKNNIMCELKLHGSIFVCSLQHVQLCIFNKNESHEFNNKPNSFCIKSLYKITLFLLKRMFFLILEMHFKIQMELHWNCSNLFIFFSLNNWCCCFVL